MDVAARKDSKGFKSSARTAAPPASQNVPTAANAGRGEGTSWRCRRGIRSLPPRRRRPAERRRGRMMLRAFLRVPHRSPRCRRDLGGRGLAAHRGRDRREDRRPASPRYAAPRRERAADHPPRLHRRQAHHPGADVLPLPDELQSGRAEPRADPPRDGPRSRLPGRQGLQRDLLQLRPEGTRIRCCGLQEDDARRVRRAGRGEGLAIPDGQQGIGRAR